MIWLAWRQVRIQTWITVALLVAAGAALAVTGAHLATLWRDSGAAACHGTCVQPIEQFLYDVRNTGLSGFYDATTVALWVIPPLFGLFWGAPMVAREVEAGTHRLAWNQSVSRTRWLATKLAVGALAAAAAVTALVIALTFWAHHLDRGAQLAPKLFGVRGVVPVAYAVFAFVLGATAGALLRRTVPAMAATLGVYVAVVASMPLWLRQHIGPVRHTLAPLDVDRVLSLRIGPNMPVDITGVPTVDGWVLSNHTVTADGAPFHAVGDPVACSGDGGFRSCQQWLASLNLRESLTYHPLSSFWPVQFIEAGIFLTLAAALAAVCFTLVRRIS
jgi:hypothetical protein